MFVSGRNTRHAVLSRNHLRAKLEGRAVSLPAGFLQEEERVASFLSACPRQHGRGRPPATRQNRSRASPQISPDLLPGRGVWVVTLFLWSRSSSPDRLVFAESSRKRKRAEKRGVAGANRGNARTPRVGELAHLRIPKTGEAGDVWCARFFSLRHKVGSLWREGERQGENG